MRVELLDHTKLSNGVIGLRNCWQSYGKGGNYLEATDDITDIDKDFLDRIINKHFHETGAEFMTYVFKIYGMSIGCLGQLTRHRHASFLVKSTRYCKAEESVLTGDPDIDNMVKLSITRAGGFKTSNDISKYALPQGTSTDVVMSINMRSLFNFLDLRTSSHAHFEIQELAHKIFDQLPDQHKYLVSHCVVGSPEWKESCRTKAEQLLKKSK